MKKVTVELLTDVLNEYVERHQIGKSINLLNRGFFEKDLENIPSLKCIRNFIEPLDGWPDTVRNSSNMTDVCYYCKQHIKEMFPESPEPTKCSDCYRLCVDNYLEGNGLKLTKKKRRK